MNTNPSSSNACHRVNPFGFALLTSFLSALVGLFLLSPSPLWAQQNTSRVFGKITQDNKPMSFAEIEKFVDSQFNLIAGEDLILSSEEYQNLPEVKQQAGPFEGMALGKQPGMSEKQLEAMRLFAGQLQLSVFRRMDKNGDNLVTAEEYRKDVMEAIKPIDINRNKLLEVDEVTGHHKLQKSLGLFSSGRSFEAKPVGSPGF